MAAEDLAEIVVQVNGKLRSHLAVPFNTPKGELERLALSDPRVQPFIDGKELRKVVVVPDKLVNVVAR